jgi:hypothetical protein
MVVATAFSPVAVGQAANPAVDLACAEVELLFVADAEARGEADVFEADGDADGDGDAEDDGEGEAVMGDGDAVPVGPPSR